MVVDIGAGFEELGPDFRGDDHTRGSGVDDDDSLDGDGDIPVVEEEHGVRATGFGCCFQWKWFPDVVGDGKVSPRVVALVVVPSTLADRPLDRGHRP